MAWAASPERGTPPCWISRIKQSHLAGEVQDPDGAGNAHDHPAQGGVVHTEGQAGAIAVQAVVDLQEKR